MYDFWVVLRAEADAGENTFTLAIREHRWDRDLFARLEAAMRRAREALAATQSVDRWFVRGFYLWTDWARGGADHPEFPRPDDAYFAAARRRLADLAYWFAVGDSPHGADYDWPPL